MPENVYGLMHPETWAIITDEVHNPHQGEGWQVEGKPSPGFLYLCTSATTGDRVFLLKGDGWAMDPNGGPWPDDMTAGPFAMPTPHWDPVKNGELIIDHNWIDVQGTLWVLHGQVITFPQGNIERVAVTVVI